MIAVVSVTLLLMLLILVGDITTPSDTGPAEPCTEHDQQRSCGDDDDTCVTQNQWCDGVTDCKNGADEVCTHVSGVFRNWVPTFTEGFHENTDKCLLLEYPEECQCVGTRLTCEGVGLTTVPLGIRLPENLTKLILPGNNIESLASRVFSNYNNLRLINMSGNMIRKIDINAFNGLLHLRALILEHNNISRLLYGMFSQVPSLHKLYLSSNRLVDWDPDVFYGIQILEWLFVRGNRIQLARTGMFRNLEMLKYIYLDNNQITELREGTFTGLKAVELLNVSHNSISTISSGSFRGLKLKELSLSWNKITFLFPEIFENQVHLSDLDLSNNPLNSLPEQLFYKMPGLRNLNLEELELINLSKKMFNYSSVGLEHINFKKFYYCAYAPQVTVCTPKTDGISSRANLLESLVLTVFSWIIGILALFANVFVIGVRTYLWRGSGELTKVHSVSIMSLAAADLIMGVYIFIISSADATYKSDYSKHSHQWVHSHLCRFSGCLSVISFDVSALLLAFMAVERYIRLVYKPFAQMGMSIRTALECIVVCWFVGLFAAILPLFAQLDDDNVQVFYGQNGVCLPLFIHEAYFKGWWMSMIIFVVTPASAAVVIICCYISVFRHIEETRQAATEQVRADKPHLNKILGITISNFLCWVPIITVKVMALCMYIVPGQVYSWMAVFVLPLNCCLNPIIYTIMSPELMKRLPCFLERNPRMPSATSYASFLGHMGPLSSSLQLSMRRSHSSTTLSSSVTMFRQCSSHGLSRRGSSPYQKHRLSHAATKSYWLPAKSSTCTFEPNNGQYEPIYRLRSNSRNLQQSPNLQQTKLDELEGSEDIELADQELSDQTKRTKNEYFH